MLVEVSQLAFYSYLCLHCCTDLKPYFKSQGRHCIVGQSNKMSYPLFIIKCQSFFFLIIDQKLCLVFRHSSKPSSTIQIDCTFQVYGCFLPVREGSLVAALFFFCLPSVVASNPQLPPQICVLLQGIEICTYNIVRVK